MPDRVDTINLRVKFCGKMVISLFFAVAVIIFLQGMSLVTIETGTDNSSMVDSYTPNMDLWKIRNLGRMVCLYKIFLVNDWPLLLYRPPSVPSHGRTYNQS